MKTSLAICLIIIAVVGTSIISISSLNSLSDLTNAFAGTTLNSEDVAKNMQVKIKVVGQQKEHVFDSFSRIGFVSGTGSKFLLESLPSLDKKPFYELVQKSLSSQNQFTNPTRLDIKIDISTQNYELIHTLVYNKCTVTEYFVHSVDSKGKFRFLEDDDSDIEFREVTMFECFSFSINLEK